MPFKENYLKKMGNLHTKKQIEKMKDFLKKDETVQKFFSKHGVDINWIDYIPIKFDDLDVSAKTDHGIIILNNKLLDNIDFKEMCGYVVHECIHYLQQCFGDTGTKSSDADDNYLDNPYEQEAFKHQVEFLSKNKSDEHAEDYVDNLIDHHDVDQNKRQKTEDILLSQV